MERTVRPCIISGWLRANDNAKGVSTIPDFARFCKKHKV